MLKTEVAQERLKQWRVADSSEDDDDDDGQNRVVAAAKALPAKLQEIALEIMRKRDDEEDLTWEESHKIQSAAVGRLDSLSPSERAQIFSLVSPHLVAAMEATWQLYYTMPYQTGWTRKAFRVPSDFSATLGRRGSWLESMLEMAAAYQAEALTLPWLAAWAPYLGKNYSRYDGTIAPLLAATLGSDLSEADEVFEILRQSLTNQHEIGGMGRHVIGGFLLSPRKEGWELVEKTLLAAQRQEGLRQSILEAADETHPDAFRRMLRLILEEDLIRFSSVVRAVDVWFGHLWSAATPAVIKKMLTSVIEYLDDPAARRKAAAGNDPEEVFLAMWCEATNDALASIDLAKEQLAAKKAELRYVAARHLANLGLPAATAVLKPMLADEHLHVAMLALVGADQEDEEEADSGQNGHGHFDAVEKLLARIPDKQITLKPIVWPWTERVIKREDVAGQLLGHLGKLHPSRMIPHLPTLHPYRRRDVVEKLVEKKPWNVETRAALLKLAGDSAADVRTSALDALAKEPLENGEIVLLEGYLTRKTGDLRRGVLTVLQKQSDEGSLASADRLLEAKDASQRLAGLELLRLLADAKRSAPACRARGEAYRASRKKLTKDELGHLQELAVEKESLHTLDDALGLMNPEERSPVVLPQDRNVPFITPAALACLRSLHDLIHEHRETPVKLGERYGSQTEELLGNITWQFPGPSWDKPPEKGRADLALAELWEKWWAERPAELRDADGLELARAEIRRELTSSWQGSQFKQWAKKIAWRKELHDSLQGPDDDTPLRYGGIINYVLSWLQYLHPAEPTEYFLDAAETIFSRIPPQEMALLVQKPEKETKGRYGSDEIDDWRYARGIEDWTNPAEAIFRKNRKQISDEYVRRLWQLMHWRDQPIAGANRKRPDADLLIHAYCIGAATFADFADHLLGPRGKERYGNESFELLGTLTHRKLSKEWEAFFNAHPEILELRNKAVARILDLELARGDSPTAATLPAHSLSALEGIATLRRILDTIGKADFKIGRAYGDDAKADRRQTLTHLAKITYPASEETPEMFAREMREAVKAGTIPEERVLQLAFLAPQWAKHIETYFAWDHLCEGLYWFIAHMKYVWGGGTEDAALAAGVEADADVETEEGDSAQAAAESDDDTSEDNDDNSAAPKARKLSAWERLILERTPLTDAERSEGAIDVAWFRRTHEQLGDKRWQQLAAAARFASNASQARRAQFIADVLLGKASRKDLITSIRKKQLKENVRLLGLLPMAAGQKRDADLMERCKVLQEYRRYANKLSGLTKPSALRACEIGLKNLAQTAGFGDPMRLEWAIGAEAVRDLIKGPVSLTKDGVTVTLSLDEQSKPSIAARRGDKELKTIPPAVKKDKKIAELTGRVADLKRQASGIRKSLEAAMCRGDTFSGDELKSWCSHALLWPLLSRLVIVGEGILGYPVKGGKALRNYRGKLEPVKPKEVLRLAHSHDLLETDAWQDWQRECFQTERVQPFKQVFRELYVVTKQEKKDGQISHRYDGQQVQPKQALALFGSRGWNTGDGVFKVFHDEGLTAEVRFNSGVTTPAEVEGWTMAGIYFRKRDEWKPIKLTAVPSRLFSEVMRDLDLVVSVAHAGGVDPEASASTVEMRANLLRETCQLLKIKNVRLKAQHALIDGDLANYSIHLGSGNVHRMPGGHLCIVPVHAQHRGRLFLPFVDDDPRTAEVVSKTLLLARDKEIQDPTILEQLRR
jgi:Domain of unknown function (DUF4132)/Family of unknown function (DUF5724)